MPWSPGRQCASWNQLAISETVSTPSYTESPSYKHLEDSYLLQWPAVISWLAAFRYWPELSLPISKARPPASISSGMVNQAVPVLGAHRPSAAAIDMSPVELERMAFLRCIFQPVVSTRLAASITRLPIQDTTTDPTSWYSCVASVRPPITEPSPWYKPA
jgi:hypothetical protein